ncbi:MAG: hypothetical protein KAX94_01265, partial [Acidovorax sp.]|nr:hypothetical protein [Acidovorax sp.]
GDREKFGQSFHHTHDGGLDQQNNVHAIAPFDQIKRELSGASPLMHLPARGRRRLSRSGKRISPPGPAACRSVLVWPNTTVHSV